jgi:MFS family permease
MICFFLIGPRLTNLQRFRVPLWLGFSLFLLSQLLLVIMPPQAALWLLLSVILEAVASALANPMIESLLALSMESAERARISAMVSVALIMIISPFGWIAGQLSALNRSLPFALNTGLFALGILLVWWFSRPGFLPLKADPAEDEKSPLIQIGDTVTKDASHIA